MKPADPAFSDQMLPVRMLNEYAYCPRLFHLMHVDGRWEANIYTDEGRSAHRRVDAADDELPDPPTEGGDEPPCVARSVSLGSPVRDAFGPDRRNRRPPRDPLNALLSYGYALLAKECTVALLAEGLDPWWGLYHRPRHGRPALALDLMEEFRPLVVDSAVLTAVNTGMVAEGDFTVTASGCAMKPAARKALIRAYEARLDQLITHPAFDYRCSWRAVIRLQARLLAKWLRGDIPAYTGIMTR